MVEVLFNQLRDKTEDGEKLDPHQDFFMMLGEIASALPQEQLNVGYLEIKNGKQTSWEFVRTDNDAIVRAMLAKLNIVFGSEPEVSWMKHNLREIAIGRQNRPGKNQELRFGGTANWQDWIQTLSTLVTKYPYHENANKNIAIKRFFQGFGHRDTAGKTIKSDFIETMRGLTAPFDKKETMGRIFGPQGLNWLTPAELDELAEESAAA